MDKKQESKISVQAHEAETEWGGFLVDEDASPVAAFFERAKRAAVVTDRGIVLKAQEEARTIITSNRWDFVGHVKELQNPPNNKKCSDLWGLLVIPNRRLNREKHLTAIRHGVKVHRFGTLRWPGVAVLNLYVHMTDEGRLNISRFERCPYCEKSGIEIRKPWNTWYYSLPVVGR